jgi:hypothetical protein
MDEFLGIKSMGGATIGISFNRIREFIELASIKVKAVLLILEWLLEEYHRNHDCDWFFYNCVELCNLVNHRCREIPLERRWWSCQNPAPRKFRLDIVPLEPTCAISGVGESVYDECTTSRCATNSSTMSSILWHGELLTIAV